MNKKKDRNSVKTPDYILEFLKNKYFKQTKVFDPCPLILDWDPKIHTDGLKIKWGDGIQPVFVNPPYNISYKFIKKAYEEFISYGTKIILLVKVSSICTHTFRRIAKPFHILFLDDRVQFDNFKRRAPFQSCFLMLGFKKGSTFEIISLKN